MPTITDEMPTNETTENTEPKDQPTPSEEGAIPEGSIQPERNSPTNSGSVAALDTLNQPELQARYAEVLGKPTKVPNRVWLIRKITEELKAREGGDVPETSTDGASEVAPETSPATDITTSTEDGNTPVAASPKPKVRKVASSRGAKKPAKAPAKVRTGAVRKIGRFTTNKNFVVLPVQMDPELAFKMDKAWKRLGLSSRMQLFRRALHDFLVAAGEERVGKEILAADRRGQAQVARSSKRTKGKKVRPRRGP